MTLIGGKTDLFVLAEQLKRMAEWNVCIFKFIFRSREKRGKEKQKIIINDKKQFGKGSFVY